MTDNYKKLDARGRRLLAQLDPDTQLELLLRLETDPEADQLQALQSIGCRIRSGAGNVLTASVAASKLPELTELPFVENVQLSRETFDENA